MIPFTNPGISDVTKYQFDDQLRSVRCDFTWGWPKKSEYCVRLEAEKSVEMLVDCGVRRVLLSGVSNRTRHCGSVTEVVRHSISNITVAMRDKC